MNESFVIECNNLSKFFYTDKREKFYALKNISFNIEKNTISVISGKNGSGKTTLLYILASLFEKSSGTVNVSSTPGIVLQDSLSSILGDTPFDDVAFSLRGMHLKKDEREKRVKELLERVNLSHKIYSPALSLSGGEKKRLSIASVLALNKDIILLDEPYSGLDYEGVKNVNHLIEKLHSENITLVIVTHEIEKCLALASKFIILNDGEIAFDGNPCEALSLNLEKYGIKNPLTSYTSLSSLVWR